MPFYPATRAAMLAPSTVAAIIAPATCQIHTHQTGKFVIASNNGDDYVLVLYDYDSNSILVEALQSCTGQCFLLGESNHACTARCCRSAPDSPTTRQRMLRRPQTHLLVVEGLDYQLLPSPLGQTYTPS
jgi:hypothetical protein